MHLDLSDDETAALTKELDDITRNDRYPFSERIRTLKGNPRQAQAATGVQDAAAYVIYGLETRARMRHPLRAIVSRPAFLSSRAGEAPRSIGRRFSVFRSDAG